MVPCNPTTIPSRPLPFATQSRTSELLPTEMPSEVALVWLITLHLITLQETPPEIPEPLPPRTSQFSAVPSLPRPMPIPPLITLRCSTWTSVLLELAVVTPPLAQKSS